MSTRADLAERLAAIIREHRMTAPFGGSVSKGDKYYAVDFAKPRWLDGVLRVYSPKFILIECQGPHARGDHRGVYSSEADAAKFLHHMGRHEIDEALAIPTRK